MLKCSEGYLYRRENLSVKKITDPALLTFLNHRRREELQDLWSQLREEGFAVPLAVLREPAQIIIFSPWIDGVHLNRSLTLARYLAEGAKQIAKAHARGIFHGDLSWQNLLLKESVTWIDWTNCGYFGDKIYRGNRYFLAPELEDTLMPTVETEVFALGKILEMVFDHEPKLATVRKKACALQPRNRFSSAEDFAEALLEAI